MLVAPSLEVGMFQDPAVRLSQQTALGIFNARLVVSGIGYPQVLQTLTVSLIHLIYITATTCTSQDSQLNPSLMLFKRLNT